MTVKIGCVVEGKSEVVAVPILIRRVAAIHYPELATVIPTPSAFQEIRFLGQVNLNEQLPWHLRILISKVLYLSSLTVTMIVQQN